MSDPNDAVRILEQRGIMVKVLPSPLGASGWRFRLKSHGGIEYQISNDELLRLMEEDKLHWDDIRSLVEKARK